VYLNSVQDIQRAMRYVENNPMREGHKPQRWGFVTALDDHVIEETRRKRRR
jgi:hypothetical protein